METQTNMLTSIKHAIVKSLLLLRPFVEWGLVHINQHRLVAFLTFLIRRKTETLSSTDSLAFLFLLEKKLYEITDLEALRYGNGLHPKHWQTGYHEFFIQNIAPGSRVLDVGCGVGIVAYDISRRVPGVQVCGIDIAAENIELATQKFSAENICFLCGDALEALPNRSFDVIVLSNILEHIEKRVDFLRSLQEKYYPQKLLIRVPVFERDWRIALQAELGLDYRSDQTHYIEHRQEEFFEEMAQAGMVTKSFHVKWGEIWAEVVSNES